MKLLSTVEQYQNLLVRLKVAKPTAAKWAPVMHRTIKEDTFSKGVFEFSRFLPQILHESGKLEFMVEKLNYSEKRIVELGMQSKPGTRWRSLVPRAKELASKPGDAAGAKRMAEAVYGGRLGNRPEGSGDGWDFIGRSPIHITGADNYRVVGELMGQDLLVVPQLLEQPHYALEACIYWWEDRIPDAILGDDLRERIRVNGGKFGLEQTTALSNECDLVLECMA